MPGLIPLHRLYKTEAGLCWICGLHVPRATEIPSLSPTRDHSNHKPRNHQQGRIRLAHYYCNQVRGRYDERAQQAKPYHIISLRAFCQMKILELMPKESACDRLPNPVL